MTPAAILVMGVSWELTNEGKKELEANLCLVLYHLSMLFRHRHDPMTVDGSPGINTIMVAMCLEYEFVCRSS